MKAVSFTWSSFRGRALRSLFTPTGSPVVEPTPIYRSFFGAIELADREAVKSPVIRDEHGYFLDLAPIDTALEGGARTALLCHSANPIGRVFAPPGSPLSPSTPSPGLSGN